MKRAARWLVGTWLVLGFITTGAHWVRPSSGNPPTGYTGAPGESTCTSCHSGGSSANSPNLSLSGLPSSWVPGTPYELTLTLNTGTRRGFLITAESSDIKRGTWSDLPDTNEDDVLATDWVGHRNANTDGTWGFTWTAPSAGAGTITFYVAANAANNDNGQGGDVIHTKTFTATELVGPSITTIAPAFGSAVEVTTLTGTNFIGLVSTVSFGGVNANCTSGDATQLVCPVPPGISDGNISVTVANSGGTSAGKAFFAIASSPTVSAINPTFSASTDTARNVTITGTRFSKSATAKLAYGAESDILLTSVVVNSTTSLTGVVNATLGIEAAWNVMVTNPDGKPGQLDSGFSILTSPAAPSLLVGTPTAAGAITWSWQDNSSNETSVQLLTSTGGAVSPLLAAGTTSYVETGLSGNASTTRKARAANAVANADSPTASTYTFVNAPTAPAATSSAESSASFAWATSNATGTQYTAEIATGSFATTAVHATSSTLALSATFQTLSVNTTYFFRVGALGYDAAASAYTAEITTPTRANAPVGTAITTGSASSFTVVWTANGNPDGTLYEAQSSTSAGFAGPLSVLTTTFSRGFSSLTPNTTYHARVRALSHASIPTAFDAAATTVTLAALPGTPIAVDFTTGSIRAGWTNSGNPGDTLYTAEISTADFGPVLATVQGTATQAFFDGLTPSTSYWFRLKATDRLGRATAFTVSGFKRTSSVTLAAPAAVTVTALGVSSQTITWSSVTLAVHYNLYSSTDTGNPFASGITTTTFARVGLSANTAYAVRIVGVNADSEEGTLSAAVAAFTLANPPTASTATVVSSTSIRVTWTASGATAYAVERATATGGIFAVTGGSTTIGSATTYLDLTLLPSTTYAYRVRGFSGDAIATAYDAVIATITNPSPPAVPALTGVPTSTGSIHWSWTVGGGPVASFTLFTSSAGVVASLAGSATFYEETGLAAGTSFARYLKAQNASAALFSSTVTVATPQAASAVPVGSPTSVTGGDGSTRIDIPAGAFGASGQAALSLDPANNPLVPGIPSLILAANASLGSGLLGPSASVREFIAVVGGQRFTGTFASPVVIRVPYPDANNDGLVDGVSPSLSAANLRLYHLDENTGLWTEVPGSSVDAVAKVVTASVNHLSVFAPFGLSAQSSLSGLKVYPNPWKPGAGGSFDASGILFDNLTSVATIKIFTTTGRLVRELSKVAADGASKLWDGRNEDGAKVASGVYLYLVSNSAGSKSGKVAVIR